MRIIGAGLAGLLAANMLRKHNPIIIESKESLPNNHTALLRHRDVKVAEATSIPFREVNVTKAINFNGKIFNEPSISFSNMYSKKVTGAYYSRSIDNLKPVKRYVAPPDFIDKLAMGCDISYGCKLDCWDIAEVAKNSNVISTIPLPVMSTIYLPNIILPEFKYKEITVLSCYIKDECDIYQTIYYPNPSLQVYRISITGNKVMAEFIGNNLDESDWDRHGVETAEDYIKHFLERDFGIYNCDLENFQIKNNKFGKIKPIENDFIRKKLIANLTKDFGIYSLGRYATWRNLLLDDVHDDILVIEKLIANNGYFTGS